MKCAIFLLSLCAFKTVFAVKPKVNTEETLYVKDLGNLHHKYTTQMEDIVSNFHNDAEDLVALSQPKNTQVIKCLAEHRELERYYEAEITLCGYCYRNALRHGNLKEAEECYIHHLDNLNIDAAKRHQEIQVCIKGILDGHSDYIIRTAPLARPSTSNQLIRGQKVSAESPKGKPVETPYVKELGDLHQKYTSQMEYILSKFHDDAEDLIALTQLKNTQVSKCLAEHRELERYYQAEISQCGYCYRNALGHGNLKEAEECYLHHLHNLNIDAAQRHQEIRVCIKAILNGHGDYIMRPAPLAKPSTSNQLTRGQTVLAVNPQGKPVETPFVKQLRDIIHKSTTEMEAIVSKFHDDAEALVALTQPKNTQVSKCLAEIRELERYYEAEINLSSYCYRDAHVHRDIEVAEKCYLAHVINVQSEAVKRNQEIRNCIKAILDGQSDYTMRPAPIAESSTSNKSKTA